MKILITGHSGFIGQALVPRLNVEHQLHLLQSDLRDHHNVYDELASFDPEIIVHLAARTEVEQSFYEPNTFADVNFTGTVNLIESARRGCSNLRDFVFASTMEVYGWQPISDEVRDFGRPRQPVAFDPSTRTNPNAPYAVAKLACEFYLQYLNRSIGFPFTAIRQTNSFGRHDNDFFVTEQIITQMLRGQPKINLGYAEPFRNFLYIDDLIDAWMSVIQHADGKQGKIYTLGPDDPVKIRDYAEMIADMIGWSGTINWNTKPARIGEIYWLNSNHDLITHDLGWQPRLNLKQGLEKTIATWKRNLGLTHE